MLACCSGELKLRFALSRFGGHLCTSEHFCLKWSDILADQIIVTSHKTEHHEGKESRIIPLFPELREALEELRSPANKPSALIFQQLKPMDIRRPMVAAIRRAGLTLWSKLFHTPRASRETELTESYPIQTVWAWIPAPTNRGEVHSLKWKIPHSSLFC